MSAPPAGPGAPTAPTQVLSWSHPKTTGCSPPPRWGHSSSSLLPSLFFFGGCSGGRGVEEVVELDVERMVWRRAETRGEGPGPRDSHSSVVGRRGEMIVFGGTDGRRKANDVHILDLNSMEWVKAECRGEAPAARESHSGTLVGDDKLVVFGGNGGGDDGKCLNDLHILDLDTMVWSSPTVDGTPPAPRDSHCAVAVGSTLVVYGGDSGDRYHDDVHVFDMVTYTWSRMPVFGRSPGPRAGHSAVCIEAKIYVTGGVGDNHYHNDVWVLDVGKCSWTELGIRGGKLQGRFSHVASVVGSDIIIYGGCGEDERPLDELILLRPTTDHRDEFTNMPFFEMLGKPSSAESSSRSGRRNQDRSNIQWKKWGNRVPELGSGHDFRFIHGAKWRSAEAKNEEEEHSISLSQNSPPVSQSDHEHPRAYKAKEPAFLSHGFRPKTKKTKNSSCRFGETSDQRSRKRLLHHSGDEPACSTASQPKHNDSPGFQSLVGAEIRGKVDAAFESGFLMTATVDGRLLRGVLFEPAPGILNRSTGNPENPPASWPEFSQRFGSLGQICEEKEGKKCMGRETNDRRSDLQGVLLTLGGPTSCSD